MKGKMEVPIPKRTKEMPREELTRRMARTGEKMATEKEGRVDPENDTSCSRYTTPSST